MNYENAWIDIIAKLYVNLHTSDKVMHVSKESDSKRQRLLNYFKRLEDIHNKVSSSKNKTGEKVLKEFYYDLYVIKPENIPYSYFEQQKRIARERGYGNIEITNETKNQMINQVIEDQKRSLDAWIEYFLYDEESKSYEMWEKYWVFQGLQKLGKFNKETGKFSKRDKQTIYPFPPVEREFIFTTLNLMEEYLKSNKSKEELKQVLSQGNFKTLYEYSIKCSLERGNKQSNTTEGVWIKYEQGSDYNKLRNSLQGYYTGWCTAAGENFAKDQLKNGDFYVYYTIDQNNEPKVPRIAIRMEGQNTIAEIRGIADDQNMEVEMLPILNEKLKQFPDKDKYLKKEHDMKLLTLIEYKNKNNIQLTKEEILFLYEINNKIDGFGFKRDPRIKEIQIKRNIKQDLSQAFNCTEEEIGITLDEFKNSQKNGKQLKYYKGNLDLRHLTSAEGLLLPQSIEGYLDLNSLTSAEGLVLPQSIGGYLDLNSLTSAEGLTLPQSIGKNLYLNILINAEGLTLPQSIHGSLYLNGLTSAEGLTFPQRIDGDLDLNGLTSAESLTLPQSIGGHLDLSNLTSAKGLVLPQSIHGSLYLDGLTSAEGLMLPQSIGGHLDLSNLTSAKGLTLLSDFDLNSLICDCHIKQEIMDNPEVYYINNENNRVLKKIKK